MKRLKKYFFFVHFFAYTSLCYSQVDTIKSIQFSGYTELYYSYDFAKPFDHNKPNFIFNHKRHNEINLNLAYVKAAYNTSVIRANVAAMAGNYSQYNLGHEPPWAQYIYELNLGVKLSSKQNIWLDAGIMPSHIGFESAVGLDCWTLTRSILAENSPYYETGIKLGYTTKNNKLNLALLMLNGWQRVERLDNVKGINLGVQINYKPNAKMVLNYSNFIGNDPLQNPIQPRVYHNLYAIYQISPSFGMIAGLDIGTQKDSDLRSTWVAPIIVAKLKLTNKSNISIRAEHYEDKQEAIITNPNGEGVDILGLSANFDLVLYKDVVWRLEAKYYGDEKGTFGDKPRNFSATTSWCKKF